MDDETLPVAADEFILRRIHRVYYQADLPVPVQFAAFRPNAQDDTGLSVFRERFTTAADVLAGLPADKRADYYLARLAVSELRKLGLTVVPDPDPDGPTGHAVIPELSNSAYRAEKQRLKQVQLELAELAGQNLVHTPD